MADESDAFRSHSSGGKSTVLFCCRVLVMTGSLPDAPGAAASALLIIFTSCFERSGSSRVTCFTFQTAERDHHHLAPGME
jgi:hypothetical protein